MIRVTAHRSSIAVGAVLAIFLLRCAATIGQQVPGPPDLDRAASLLQAGKPGDARELFESLLRAEPSNLSAQDGEVRASERLALNARGAGDMDGALRVLLRARSFAPRNGRLLYDLGVLEDEMQLFREADQTLAAAEKLIPDNASVWYAWARVKLDLGQLGPAEEKMTAYLKVHPEDATAHYGLGRVYQLGLHFDKARAEFQRSIELLPAQTEAYYQLGDMAMQEGNFEEALADFAKTLSRNPKHGGALAETGQVYFKEKKYDKALESLQQAIAAAPDYQPGHYFLGLTLARLGKEEESKRELDVATKLADAENNKSSHRRRLNPQGLTVEGNASDPH